MRHLPLKNIISWHAALVAATRRRLSAAPAELDCQQLQEQLAELQR
jgi:hypothetical protein